MNNNSKKVLKLIGLRVQFLRQQQGLTQEELAKEINKTVDTISNIECGISFARIDTLMEITKAVNAELADFFNFPVESKVTKKKSQLIKRVTQLLANESDKTVNECLKVLESILSIEKKKN